MLIGKEWILQVSGYEFILNEEKIPLVYFYLI